MVKPDMGRISPMGFTRRGSYYYGLRTGMNDVYVATLDLATGKLLAPPTKATQRFVGSNHGPAWSPDGKYLAYISQRGPSRFGRGSRIISIRSVKTGEERELSPNLNRLGHRMDLPWSPMGVPFLSTVRTRKTAGVSTRSTRKRVTSPPSCRTSVECCGSHALLTERRFTIRPPM